jgi:hypothetical protein
MKTMKVLTLFCLLSLGFISAFTLMYSCKKSSNDGGNSPSSGTNVYVCYWVHDPSTNINSGFLWKNGKVTQLGDMVYDMYVSGSDVYVGYSALINPSYTHQIDPPKLTALF